jgi:rare lipoprotein A
MGLKLFIGMSAGAFIVAAMLLGVSQGWAGECDRAGKASWYGGHHHGRLMANGKPFNMHAMTAAMWDVPLGSAWIVRNVQNGKSVRIVVTDRGPARRLNRIIDLSKAAAGKLGIIRAGTGKVCLTRL